MRRPRTVLVGGLVAASAVAACSLLVPLDDAQCQSDGDCTARGAAFACAVCVDHSCQRQPLASDADGGGADGGTVDAADASNGARDPWRCLGEPGQTVDPTKEIDLEIHALDALKQIVTAGVNGGSDLDLLSGTALDGVTVRGCDAFDPTCASPILPSKSTDDAGVVHYTVHGDFAGYFELTRSDLFPSTVFPGRVLNGVPKDALIFPLLSIFATKQVAQTLGVPLATDPDGGLGHAFFLNYDCDDRHGAGVAYSLGDGGAPDGAVFFYQRGQFPDPSATSTDSLGFGGVINYPAGFAVVTATDVATGRTLGTITTIIRPAETSFTWIRVRTR